MRNDCHDFVACGTLKHHTVVDYNQGVQRVLTRARDIAAIVVRIFAWKSLACHHFFVLCSDNMTRQFAPTMLSRCATLKP